MTSPVRPTKELKLNCLDDAIDQIKIEPSPEAKDDMNGKDIKLAQDAIKDLLKHWYQTVE